MTSITVRSEADRDSAIVLIQNRAVPFTVSITKGVKRSLEQNKWQRKMLKEIAEQRGDVTPEEVRGECKLRFGVPILRAENDVFCEKYDRLIKPLPYETKIEYMMEPLDFPVSRLLTTEQATRYLDAMYQYFTAKGFRLTHPDDQGRAA